MIEREIKLIAAAEAEEIVDLVFGPETATMETDFEGQGKILYGALCPNLPRQTLLHFVAEFLDSLDEETANALETLRDR